MKETAEERGNSKHGAVRLVKGSQERLGDLAGVSLGEQERHWSDVKTQGWVFGAGHFSNSFNTESKHAEKGRKGVVYKY